MSPPKRVPPRVSASLEEYQAKRDFTVTAEPSGAESPAHATSHKALAFVLQKHDASHLHFDLRLEVDGVMKSWAVPKGPSVDPSVRRLAMEVEDHPVAYNTFEGTIPSGEYGGGTVMLWDRGTWTPDELHRGESPDDAARRALAAGKLAFSFHGKRLQGSFALVRTRQGEHRAQWLLLKHRDDFAGDGRDIVAETMTSVATGRTMEQIAGNTAASGNGAAKKAAVTKTATAKRAPTKTAETKTAAKKAAPTKTAATKTTTAKTTAKKSAATKRTTAKKTAAPATPKPSRAP